MKFQIECNSSFVDGAFIADSGKNAVLLNPSTLEPVCQVSYANEADCRRAVDAAIHAQRVWYGQSASHRRDAMLKIATLMAENYEELAYLDTITGGKPISSAIQDVEDAIDVFKYYAGFADKICGGCFNDGVTTRREPVGVVASIVSFNYPLLLATWKIAPALACGNAVVVKPSEKTPLSVLRLASLATQAGLPNGLLSILVGDGVVGSCLCSSPGIDRVSFTGSLPTGCRVMQSSASVSALKPVTLELGGKSPVLVFEDAFTDKESFSKLIEELFGACFSNMGQNCCAGTRLYCHSSIYTQVLEGLKARISQVKMGDTFDKQTDFGPLTDEICFSRVEKMVSDAKRDHKFVEANVTLPPRGYYVKPTSLSILTAVFYDVEQDSYIAREEVFGPVLAMIKPFASMDEAVFLANDSPYGLAGGVFSTDHRKINHCIKHLKVGTVWVNSYNVLTSHMPFGGVKGSGFGKDLGKDAINEFTFVKTVYWND